MICGVTTQTPVVRGLPVLGSALQMARDPAQFFVDSYREHGPVFRVRILNQKYAVIAGIEAANYLGTQEGRENLRSKEFWQGLVDEYGATRVIMGEDGAAHKELREIMRRGYSREAIVGRLDEVIEITDRNLEETWRPGGTVPVVRAMQYLVTDQLGQLLTGESRPEYVADIRTATLYILNVLVTRQRPKILLADPRYKRAKARIAELGHKILGQHREQSDRPAILVDDIMRAHRDDPAAMPADDLILGVTAPYVAGLDTVANTLAAFVYAVLKHPQVHARVRAEADELFSRDEITEKDLRGIPAIRGALMETMRLYPIAVAQIRTATRDFTFEGHPIAAGESVYLGTTVPHFLDEYFPDAKSFDIDRYEKPRAEHLQAGAYSPYGRGQHVCLGKSLADIQMLVTTARMFHKLDMSLESPDYTLVRKTAPGPGPAMTFRIRVDGYRN
jgi:cytochrome P450